MSSIAQDEILFQEDAQISSISRFDCKSVTTEIFFSCNNNRLGSKGLIFLNIYSVHYSKERYPKSILKGSNIPSSKKHRLK